MQLIMKFTKKTHCIFWPTIHWQIFHLIESRIFDVKLHPDGEQEIYTPMKSYRTYSRKFFWIHGIYDKIRTTQLFKELSREIFQTLSDSRPFQDSMSLKYIFTF